MNIKPLSNYVLLEPLSAKEKTDSGFFVPQTADKDRPEQGKVIAVGPGKKVKGEILPLSVKKGDIVIFSKYSPTEIKIEGKEYLLVREDDILAVVE
jgi:chaperonin GroES